MKNILPLGIVLASLLAIGAGCAPQAAQKQTPAAKTQVPAGQTGAQKAGGSPAAVEKTETDNTTGVSQSDLDKLKKDIESLQFEDLSAPKN